ncbi:MAG: HNH endonuclease [Bacteroidales bacterium]|nr:HNH endonuclease [Candidatus Scybalousia scybalohippi]
MPIARPDRDGKHQAQFKKNKERIYATQTVCGICGKPVDFSIKYPHPLSPCIDHIIPIAKGGHPSDIDNLQLAHWCCNREKSDKIYRNSKERENKNTLVAVIGNRVLPQTINWIEYRAKAS